MHHSFLGDSYDIVKRFWGERLANIAPLIAHPRFVPREIRREFELIVGIPILDEGRTPSKFGLFLAEARRPCTATSCTSIRTTRNRNHSARMAHRAVTAHEGSYNEQRSSRVNNISSEKKPIAAGSMART